MNPESRSPMDRKSPAPAQPTLFEQSRSGRRAVLPPPPEAGLPAIDSCIPERFLRSRPAELPELGEIEVVRHYTRLSSMNMAIDKNFYPLGSCTMKYNPRVNEAVAGLEGFAWAHPLCAPAEIQGYLEVFHRLEGLLAEISGLPHVSLQPAAGAHGELTALMMIKARLVERGEAGSRTIVLVPDSAHGTNPSSAATAGFEARS
ncbi:MAG: aminomethyl-transferring glycine dehydrogenase subunit GcvPB, partial [Planctomycetes bacterium]|nr:aminomethyl-transferring glycine dehydrogenase subunit GcvPB [Planctomycetota bacterium]